MIAPALSGDGEVMLMIPHGLHWSQVAILFILDWDLKILLYSTFYIPQPQEIEARKIPYNKAG